ncbi:hypothetical protein PIB30_086328, partial [Stylosanthes scabra]|nr:hypothetical protein [Stylosanthes scabra]
TVGACQSCSGDCYEQEKLHSSSCEETINKKKRKREEKRKTPLSSWEYSTELMIYDDSWKLKKVMIESDDVGNMSRLLLPKDIANKLLVEVVGYNHNDKEKLDICDVKTH